MKTFLWHSEYATFKPTWDLVLRKTDSRWRLKVLFMNWSELCLTSSIQVKVQKTSVRTYSTLGCRQEWYFQSISISDFVADWAQYTTTAHGMWVFFFFFLFFPPPDSWTRAHSHSWTVTAHYLLHWNEHTVFNNLLKTYFCTYLFYCKTNIQSTIEYIYIYI